VQSRTYALVHIEQASAYTYISIRHQHTSAYACIRRSRSAVANVHLSRPNALVKRDVAGLPLVGTHLVVDGGRVDFCHLRVNAASVA
jgi:hypothetical protein